MPGLIPACWCVFKATMIQPSGNKHLLHKGFYCKNCINNALNSFPQDSCIVLYAHKPIRPSKITGGRRVTSRKVLSVVQGSRENPRQHTGIHLQECAYHHIIISSAWEKNETNTPFIESQNHRMVWVGRDLKDHEAPAPPPTVLSWADKKLEKLGWCLSKEECTWAQVLPVILEE